MMNKKCNETRVLCPHHNCQYNRQSVCYCKILYISEELKCLIFKEKEEEKGECE